MGIITIVFASIQYGTARAFFAQRYLFLGIVLLIVILLLGRVIKLAFNGRRIFFLALLTLIFIEVFDFIVFHFGFSYLISLTPAFISCFLTVILYFSSEADESQVYIISFSMLLLIYPFNYIFSFEAPSRFHIYALTGGYIFINLIGIIEGHLFIKFLDKDFGFNIKELWRAFLLFWLTMNPLYIEEKLEKIGVMETGWIKCLSIGNTKLISNSFHPGPFRGVGGTHLVGRILEIDNTMYLHSAATHDKNIVSKNEVEKLVNQIDCNGEKVKTMMPYEIGNEKFHITVFPFDTLRLMIISGNDAIDDLPSAIQEYADGFGEVVIVDAHNSYRQGYDVTMEDIEEIKTLIEKAVNIKSEKCTLHHAFMKNKINSKNVCGHLAMLILDYEYAVYALFMIDSNNIEKNFRVRVERFLENKGLKPLVISTDNHSKTGMPPKLEYEPAGADESDISAVFNFLGKIDFENVKKQEEIRYNKKVAKAKIIGKDFFENLEKAALHVGKKAIYLFFLLILIQLLVAMGVGALLV